MTQQISTVATEMVRSAINEHLNYLDFECNLENVLSLAASPKVRAAYKLWIQALYAVAPDNCGHRNVAPTTDTCAEGCCDYYRCKDCGKRILSECAD